MASHHIMTVFIMHSDTPTFVVDESKEQMIRFDETSNPLCIVLYTGWLTSYSNMQREYISYNYIQYVMLPLNHIMAPATFRRCFHVYLQHKKASLSCKFVFCFLWLFQKKKTMEMPRINSLFTTFVNKSRSFKAQAHFPSQMWCAAQQHPIHLMLKLLKLTSTL